MAYTDLGLQKQVTHLPFEQLFSAYWSTLYMRANGKEDDALRLTDAFGLNQQSFSPQEALCMMSKNNLR